MKIIQKDTQHEFILLPKLILMIVRFCSWFFMLSQTVDWNPFSLTKIHVLKLYFTVPNICSCIALLFAYVNARDYWIVVPVKPQWTWRQTNALNEHEFSFFEEYQLVFLYSWLFWSLLLRLAVKTKECYPLWSFRDRWTAASANNLNYNLT